MPRFQVRVWKEKASPKITKTNAGGRSAVANEQCDGVLNPLLKDQAMAPKKKNPPLSCILGHPKSDTFQ